MAIWTIPAHADKGPVTVTLRMLAVRVADLEGRYIVIPPAQADLVGTQDGYIVWMDDATSRMDEEDGD